MKILQYQHPLTFSYLRRLGKYFPFLWKFLSGVCESCGAHVGFHSVISRHGFQCDPCNVKSNQKYCNHDWKYIRWGFNADMDGKVGKGIYEHHGWVVSEWDCTKCNKEKIRQEFRVDNYDRDYPHNGFKPSDA